jgi:hypothetical protein
VLSQGAQDLLNVLQIFLLGFSKDEDVIPIYDQKGVCEWSQYIIHHPHEFSWGISQDRIHEKPLKDIFFKLEGYLPYINFLNRHLVVARLQINITEKFGSLELIKEIFNLRDGVLVFYCDLLYGSVTNKNSPCPILLLYQNNWAPAR